MAKLVYKVDTLRESAGRQQQHVRWIETDGTLGPLLAYLSDFERRGVTLLGVSCYVAATTATLSQTLDPGGSGVIDAERAE